MAAPGVARPPLALGKESPSDSVRGFDADQWAAVEAGSSHATIFGKPQPEGRASAAEVPDGDEPSVAKSGCLRTMLDAVERQIRDLDAERAAARKWAGALEAELDRSAARCRELEESHEALEHELTSLRGLTPRVSQLESMLEAVTRRASELESELIGATDRSEKSEQARSMLESKIAGQDGLGHRIEELQAQLAAALSRNDSLKQAATTNDALRQALAAVEAEQSSSLHRVTALEEERDRAVARCQRATTRNVVIEKEMTDLRGQLAEAVAWRQGNEQKCVVLQEQIEELTRARHTIIEELTEDREREISKLTEDQERAITILADEHDAAIAELKEQLANLGRSARREEENRASLEAQVVRMQEEHGMALTRIASLEGELKETLSEISDAQQSRQDIEIRDEATQAELQVALGQVRSLEGELMKARMWETEVEASRAEILTLKQRVGSLAAERTRAIERADTLDRELSEARAWSRSTDAGRREIEDLRRQIAVLEMEREASTRAIVGPSTESHVHQQEPLLVKSGRVLVPFENSGEQPLTPDVIDRVLAGEQQAGDMARSRQLVHKPVGSPFHTPRYLSQRLHCSSDRLKKLSGVEESDEECTTICTNSSIRFLPSTRRSASGR